MPDYFIRNGNVVDGSGQKGFPGDVVIEGDRVVSVKPHTKNAAPPTGCRVIDARGKVVCPGFIDPHSHADMTIHRAEHARLLQPLIRQGITTFIGGNCGMSLAPLDKNHFDSTRMYIEGFTGRDLAGDVTWSDTAGFMEHIEKNGMLLNCALLAPHSLIRIGVMGMANRHATDDETARMGRALELCMDAGCLGMSTGLQYMPGLQSDTRELVALGGVLKKYDGIYTSHLRSYMNALPRAVDELITVARENDIRAQVSHIFWVPDIGFFAPIVHAVARFLVKLSKYWTFPAKLDADMEEQLEKIMRHRRRGVELGVDAMPSSTTFTHLAAYLPPWVLDGTREDVAERFTNPAIRKKIRADIENGQMVWPHTGRNSWSLNVLKLLGWESTIIMSVVTPENKHLEGRTLGEIGRLRGKHPFDAMCDLLIEEEARVLVFSALGAPDDNFTEQSIFAAVKHPEVAISTDTILMGFGKPSHLFHGAYPRLFSRYVREKKMLSIETAVRKVTGVPAEHFQLKDRGHLREGAFADIVVFDPKTISPNCDFAHPTGTPTGIEHVFINGRHVLDRGTLDITPLPGRLLRR